ncbi:hypothetical protein SeGA_3207, partial [Salmonella enterica subsp. enterica serovar Gaminara str. A4-567]
MSLRIFRLIWRINTGQAFQEGDDISGFKHSHSS